MRARAERGGGGIVCQMVHLGGVCAGPQWYSPRYFTRGDLFICEKHAKLREAMGFSYPLKPWPRKKGRARNHDLHAKEGA